MSRTYSLGEASAAAGVSPAVASAWLDRNVVKMRRGDVDSDSSGVRREFSRARVLQFAIVQTLALLGHRPSDGAKAALEFTDRGSETREPAQLFPAGETLLVIDGDSATVRNLRADGQWSELASDRYGVQSDAFSVLNLRRLVDRVDGRLADYPPQYETKRYA